MSLTSATITALLLSLISPGSIAQSGDLAMSDDTPKHVFVPERAFGYLNTLDTRVVRKFKKDYPAATDERWTMGEDCLRATFDMQGRHVMVDYDTRGNWRDTYTVMDEKQMPRDVRRLIKSNFIDDHILTVTRLEAKNIDDYFVKVQNGSTSKLVRVANSEFEVIQEFRN